MNNNQMNNNISITAKLNALLVLYTIGALIFQPLASIIQIGLLIYLSRQKEWKYFTYGSILFACAIIIATAFFEHSSGTNQQFYMIALAVSVFANLFWFAATIKQLKRILYTE